MAKKKMDGPPGWFPKQFYMLRNRVNGLFKSGLPAAHNQLEFDKLGASVYSSEPVPDGDRFSLKFITIRLCQPKVETYLESELSEEDLLKVARYLGLLAGSPEPVDVASADGVIRYRFEEVNASIGRDHEEVPLEEEAPPALSTQEGE